MLVIKRGDAYIAQYKGEETKGTSYAEAIKNMLALLKLARMSDTDFQVFFSTLPARVQLLTKGGMVSWRETLPQYYSLA